MGGVRGGLPYPPPSPRLARTERKSRLGSCVLTTPVGVLPGRTSITSDSSICESYRTDGYYFPIPVLSADEARACRRRLEAFESEHQGLPDRYRFKTYLVWTWLDRLIRHPRILDAVEAVIGPNILCWSTDFIKEPPDPGFVSWHQDSTYWGLQPPEVVTAWLGLTGSTDENGCVRVVPGSHLHGQVTHHDTFGEDNLLSRGQEVMVEVDESGGVDLRLSAGEISLHHILVVHGSRPNAPGACQRTGPGPRQVLRPEHAPDRPGQDHPGRRPVRSRSCMWTAARV